MLIQPDRWVVQVHFYALMQSLEIHYYNDYSITHRMTAQRKSRFMLLTSLSIFHDGVWMKRKSFRLCSGESGGLPRLKYSFPCLSATEIFIEMWIKHVCDRGGRGTERHRAAWVSSECISGLLTIWSLQQKWFTIDCLEFLLIEHQVASAENQTNSRPQWQLPVLTWRILGAVRSSNSEAENSGHRQPPNHRR